MRGRHPYHRLTWAEKQRYQVLKLRNESAPPTLTCDGCGSRVRAGDVALHYMNHCPARKKA